MSVVTLTSSDLMVKTASGICPGGKLSHLSKTLMLSTIYTLSDIENNKILN
jgi:hypothetical protein